MFGIGIGELLVIVLVIVLLAPRQIPGVMRRIARFYRTVDKFKHEMEKVSTEIRELADEEETGSRDNQGTNISGHENRKNS